VTHLGAGWALTVLLAMVMAWQLAMDKKDKTTCAYCGQRSDNHASHCPLKSIED
jgi:hypothetical protein